MFRLRNIDEWVGLLVVAAVVLFVGAALEAGVLRDWFRPVANLRIVLPKAGVGGLAVGADVEVLGIHAGEVRRIVIDPTQQMYAEADIDAQAQAFIRRDSKAVIRRRFGLAGAAFIDLSRGTGDALDWKFAVVDSSTERNPTEGIGSMVDQVRERVFPILDDTRRTTEALAAIAGRMQKGEGTAGRLLADDTLVRGLEQTVAMAQQQVADLGTILKRLDASMADVNVMSRAASSRDAGVPAILNHADKLLGNLQDVSHDLARSTPSLPQIARNVQGSTNDLPALLTQTQVTTAELERLLAQLRGSWLLGGGATETPARLPASQVRP
jgi:phospholipid/cholesterol/gamma-HCH transport system substrate-binding protein